MNCSTAMEALMEGDLEDLNRQRDTELARHLARCQRCRAAADRILEGEQALGTVVQAVRSRVPVEAALQRVRRRARTRRRSGSLARVALPLAAAAGVAAVVLLRNGMPQGASDADPLGRAAAPVAFDLGVAPDRNVAVFESAARPGIVVIWFY